MSYPREHWTRIRTNNSLERIMREIRRRTRVVGAFPDGKSALMLVAIGEGNILTAAGIELCISPSEGADGLTTDVGFMGTVTITRCEGPFFLRERFPTTGDGPNKVIPRDFNGDGYLDLAIAN